MNLTTLQLTERFVEIKSDPDNYAALSQILHLAIEQFEGFSVEHFERNGFRSILVHNGESRPEKFKLLLNGHLDVIPGKPEQYEAILRGDKLYGVGSMDMKGSVACMINVFKEMAASVDYPLGLQIVTDEEIGGFHGTKYQVEQGVKADFVIAGESTGFDIVNKAKGIIWAKIGCSGTTAHGAYPWAGDNAIWKMNRFLTQLHQAFPVPKEKEWASTINLSRISTSNIAFNKVPDDCFVNLDIRFVPGDESRVIAELTSLIPNDFTWHIEAQEPPLDVDESNPFLQLLKKAAEKITGREVSYYGAQGSSDARHYTRVGTPGVEFGPVGGGIGTDEEWVSLQSLKDFEQILIEFMLSI